MLGISLKVKDDIITRSPMLASSEDEHNYGESELMGDKIWLVGECEGVQGGVHK